MSDAFRVSHDTELDSTGTVWNVGGGGAAGYKLTANPLAPQLLGTTGDGRAQPLALQRLHPPQLAAAREDAAGHRGGLHRHRRGPARRLPRPGQVRDLGPLAAERAARSRRSDTWETELNGMFTGGAVDSKAPVTVNCSSHWFDAKDGVAAVGWYEQGVRFLDYRTPTDITAGRLLHPGQRLDLGGVLVADRPERRDRLHRRRLPRRRRAEDRRRRPDRQEGQGAGAQRVVRQPDGRRPSSFQPHPIFGFICPVLKPDVDVPTP